MSSTQCIPFYKGITPTPGTHLHTWFRPSTLPRALPGVPRGGANSPLLEEVVIGILMGNVDAGAGRQLLVGNTGLRRCWYAGGVAGKPPFLCSLCFI